MINSMIKRYDNGNMAGRGAQATIDTEFSALAEVFGRYPDIQAVYLFGSRAAGKGRHNSDLDLAVVPRNAAVRENKLEFLTELARIGFDDVDLVFLDTPDMVLKYEAVRHNRLVYQAADFDRGTMYSNVVRQYLDLKPRLEVQRKAYRQRILGGQMSFCSTTKDKG